MTGREKFGIVFLIIFFFFFSSAIVGAQTKDMKRLSLLTGGTGGVYYPYGGGLAQVISKHVPNTTSTAEVTAAAVDNIKLLKAGKGELALVIADVASDAIQGKGRFEKDGKIPLRALAVLYGNLNHMVVLKESGINLDMTIIDHAAYKQKMREGVNPIVIWGAKFPTAVGWLRNMYHSSSAMDKPTAQNNYMYYSNPEVDKLIEIAESTLDEKERLDVLAKAQLLIVKDLPSIPCIEEFGPIVRTPWFVPGYDIKANYQFIYDIGVNSRILKH